MDYESLLLQTLSKDQLEEQVAEKINQFHGLLTYEVAMKLLVREKGLLREEEEKKVSIANIPKGGKKLSIEGTVKKIWPTAEYGSGKKSRVVEVSDATGTTPLILWNEDVKLANGLRTKDVVAVKGAYERNNELHLGYSGMLELKQRTPFSKLDSLAPDEFHHVQGFVSRVQGFDRYVSGTSAKPGFSFYLSDSVNEVQVVIWGKPGRGSSLQPGDEIIIEGALEKDHRLELSEHARLLVRRKERMLLGKVDSMEADGELLKVTVAGKPAAFARKDALKFMSIDLADDISLVTAVTIKKNHMLNTKVAVRVQEKDGRMLVEK